MSKINEQNLTTLHILTRRNFLKSGSLLVSALPFSTCLTCISCSDRYKPVSNSNNSKVLYASDFIPDGYSCKLAFIADHHYWPNHYKNWGAKQFRHTEERMRDLVETLNNETPDISIHGGDVIDAGTAFVPPYDEYIKQLNYEKEMLNGLIHPAIPIIGNHEVPDAYYESESELDEWKKRFGPLYRFTDINGWRLVCLNTMSPNPGGSKPLYGVDDEQVKWLSAILDEAIQKKLRVLLFAHIPPNEFNYSNDFENVITSAGCVKGMMVGHDHTNHIYKTGDIPVMIRASNVASPFAYSMVYPYPDGRILVKQKSQHFPFIDYMSNIITPGAQGTENDRYFTLNGSSDMQPDRLTELGNNTDVRIADGHLSVDAPNGKGLVLIDLPDMNNVRLIFSAVKEGATHIGAVACTNGDGSDRIDCVLTSEYGTDGNMYIASYSGGKKETLGVSWFNISDGISYKFVVEVKDGSIIFHPKNMPELSAKIPNTPKGKFGFFVENGKMFVTDLKLEKLG
ncbi:MAG: metallophosphoesterase [Candidatus Latescibacteria bacterium]|nr:metallophosphoesterase [Candidatus Latescibacterota bacterium]